MKFTSVKQQIHRIGFAIMVTAIAYQPALQAQSIDQPSPTSPPIDTLLFANASADNFTVKASTTSASAVTQTKRAQTTRLTKSSSAPFVGAAHPTSGTARIVEAGGQSYLEFDADFRSDSGPDLLVLLHEDAVPQSYRADNYISLGRLQRVGGAQRYAIPENVDISAFKSAVIWCRAFDVTFGYATI